MKFLYICAVIAFAIELIIIPIVTAATMTVASRRGLFWRIQFLSANLMIAGWFICLSPSLAKRLWIFWNDDDGSVGATYWARYRWLAWRNPVDNFKHVKWTQAPGPLTYKPFTWRGKQFYYKAGWMSNTYCALSAGSGRGW